MRDEGGLLQLEGIFWWSLVGRFCMLPGIQRIKNKELERCCFLEVLR